MDIVLATVVSVTMRNCLGHGECNVCPLPTGFGTSAFSSTTSAFSCWISSPSWTVSIPPRRRARGATWQKVTPKKLFGPKRDYDVMNAKIIEKYDCHTTTAALY